MEGLKAENSRRIQSITSAPGSWFPNARLALPGQKRRLAGKPVAASRGLQARSTSKRASLSKSKVTPIPGSSGATARPLRSSRGLVVY